MNQNNNAGISILNCIKEKSDNKNKLLKVSLNPYQINTASSSN